MKETFEVNLKGKQIKWFGFLMLAYWLSYFLVLSLTNFKFEKNISLNFFQWIFAILILLVYVPLYKKIIENISFKNNFFLFDGKIYDFIGIVIGGVFLSIITLGIYSPWYLKKRIDFFAFHTSYKKKQFLFIGKPFSLLLFGFIWVVVFVSFVLLIVFLAKSIDLNHSFINKTLYISFFVLFIFMQISLLYTFLIKWMLNFWYDTKKIELNVKFFPLLLVLSREFFFSLISLFIYSPIAYAKLYQYIVDKITVNENEKMVGQFKFEYETDFYANVWGQFALSFVTLGMYLPWAIANLTKAFLSHTTYEKK